MTAVRPEEGTLPPSPCALVHWRCQLMASWDRRTNGRSSSTARAALYSCARNIHTFQYSCA
eukprot:1038391-Prorocentrum_minimum.AAC.2